MGIACLRRKSCCKNYTNKGNTRSVPKHKMLNFILVLVLKTLTYILIPLRKVLNYILTPLYKI